MIINRIIKPDYKANAIQIALESLGLELFDQETVLDASWTGELQHGDFYLQYRRPGRDHILRVRGDLDAEDYQYVPPVIELNYPSREVGYLSRRYGNTTAGFRIFQVHKLVQGDTRGNLQIIARSWYSRPERWAMIGMTNQRSPSRWLDEKDQFASSYRTSHKRLDLAPNRGLGVIGKFDKHTIRKVFSDYGYVTDSKFYAFFRTLLGEKLKNDSTYHTLRDAADKLDRSLPSPCT